jgi:hypothetical protein
MKTVENLASVLKELPLARKELLNRLMKYRIEIIRQLLECKNKFLFSSSHENRHIQRQIYRLKFVQLIF